MIIIINSGGANIASIQFSLQRLGVAAKLSNDIEEIKAASHVILPGVASANSVMQRLKEYALIEVIQSLKQPVLGICLGMQILFDYSEEGMVECLKIIPGKVKKLAVEDKLSIPHMGWNKIQVQKPSALLKNIDPHAYVYFVHSYMASLGNYTLASACYGENFSAAIQSKNFFGTQFHPERSGKMGEQILKNFLDV